jgi:uncharacterized protein DUF1918
VTCAMLLAPTRAQGEREHYRIRWQDGHESVYFPGLDVRVMPAG